MHRFVTFIGGAAPGPPMGPMSDPNCVILGVALSRRTWCRFPKLALYGRRVISCAMIGVSSGGSRELNPAPRSFPLGRCK